MNKFKDIFSKPNITQSSEQANTSPNSTPPKPKREKATPMFEQPERHAPVKRITTPTTSEDYLKLLKAEKGKQEITRYIYYSFMAVVLILTILTGVRAYSSQKNEAVPVINEDNIAVTVSEGIETSYDVSYSYSYTEDDINHYDVTIGSFTTDWTEDQVNEFIGNNTQLKTAIYSISFTNNEKYFMSFLNNQSVTVVRYSILGEQPFTEAEIEAYKPLVAYHFTHAKAKNLIRTDVEWYNADINGLNSKTVLTDTAKALEKATKEDGEEVDITKLNEPLLKD